MRWELPAAGRARAGQGGPRWQDRQNFVSQQEGREEGWPWTPPMCHMNPQGRAADVIPDHSQLGMSCGSAVQRYQCTQTKGRAFQAFPAISCKQHCPLGTGGDDRRACCTHPGLPFQLSASLCPAVSFLLLSAERTTACGPAGRTTEERHRQQPCPCRLSLLIFSHDCFVHICQCKGLCQPCSS